MYDLGFIFPSKVKLLNINNDFYFETEYQIAEEKEFNFKENTEINNINNV